MNNHYRRKNFGRKRGFSRRRQHDPFNQPLAPDLERIPHNRHTLTRPDVESVVDALLSGTMSGGNELDRFESLFAKLTHSRYAFALSSTTAAFHAALGCLNLQAGDEVISSTLNSPIVANAVVSVGARLVLVDCDADHQTIDVESVRKAVTDKTKVVISNNFAGHSSDMNALREICDEHKLVLIDDARHGLGGKHRGHYIGNQADLTCFSFAPDMAITCGEGGAVTTDNSTFAAWIRLFRENGIERDGNRFDRDPAPPYWYEVHFPGQSCRLSEINAALGRSQLTRLDRHIERRRTIADFYYQKLREQPELILPHRAEWIDHAFHTFPVRLTDELQSKRDEIFEKMRERGVGLGFHYVPMHRMPHFAATYDAKDFPNAEAMLNACFSLPLFPDLSIKSMERIVETLIEALNHVRPASTKSAEKSKATAKETASETDSGEASNAEPTAASAPTPEQDEGAIKKKPARRSRTRRTTRKPASQSSETASSEDNAAAPVEDPPEAQEPAKPKRAPRRRTAAKKPADDSADATKEKKPRRRTPRKKTAAASAKSVEESQDK